MKTRIAATLLVLAALAPAPRSEAQLALRAPAGFIGEEVPEDIARMVDRGMNYLLREQGADGMWPNQGGETGPAIQGFALLALLSDGEDPRFGRYASALERGADALLGLQDGNGFFGPSMYHHAFATLALAELYGAIDEPRLGPALDRAVKLILDAQQRSQARAWRYSPTANDGDTTVSGGQLVALFAARNAGLEIPDDAIESALAFFRTCQDADGGIGYTGVGGGSGPRNAIGVLVASLGGEQDSRLHRGAWAWLQSRGEESSGYYYFYYLYYAAQAYFRADMTSWRAWNRQLANRLLQSQNARGGWDGGHGSTFCTASAILSMALNYRYLPIYER